LLPSRIAKLAGIVDLLYFSLWTTIHRILANLTPSSASLPDFKRSNQPASSQTRTICHLIRPLSNAERNAINAPTSQFIRQTRPTSFHNSSTNLPPRTTSPPGAMSSNTADVPSQETVALAPKHQSMDHGAARVTYLCGPQVTKILPSPPVPKTIPPCKGRYLTITRPYNHVTIQPRDHTTTRPYNHATIQPCDHTNTRPQNHATI
jgi:hypothetical protein